MIAVVRVSAFSSTLCGPARPLNAPPFGSRSMRLSSGPIFFIDASCSLQVFERELARRPSSRRALRRAGVDRRLDLLDEREHVAEAEDPRRHPVGMERLEVLGLLADADELDRLSGRRDDRERGAAARVAVGLREDDPRQGQRLPRSPRRTSRRPARSSRRRRRGSPAARPPPRRRGSRAIRASSMCRRPAVSTMTVSRPVCFASRTPSRATATGSWPGPARRREPRSAVRASRAAGRRPAARGRPRRCSGYRPRVFSRRASLAAEVVLPEPCSPTSAMTAGFPWSATSARSPPSRDFSSSRTMRVTSWAGRQLLGDLGADGALAHPGRELPHDRQGHVGLEQREADLPQGRLEVVVGQVALAAQLLEDALHPVAETLEHRKPPSGPVCGPPPGEPGPSQGYSRESGPRRGSLCA